MDANYQGKELKGTQNAHQKLNERYALPCFTFNPYPGATIRDKPFFSNTNTTPYPFENIRKNRYILIKQNN